MGSVASNPPDWPRSPNASPRPDTRVWCSTTATSEHRKDRPRERLSIRAERNDYRAALEFARQLPATARTVVWGCSFAGLHATWYAVNEPGLAAAIGVLPTRRRGTRDILQANAALGAAPGMRTGPTCWARWWDVLPVTCQLASPRAHLVCCPPPIRATAGPCWPPPTVRTGQTGWPPAACLASPSADRRDDWLTPMPVWLFVVPETDTAVATGAAIRAAKFPRVDVIRSRGGHYDVYPLGRDYEHVITAQLDFLATIGA